MPVVVRLLLPVLLALALLVSCARAPSLVGVENPEQPAAAVKAAIKSKIFIATTREASDVTGVFYSDQRAPELGFASVVVSIPPNHVAGQIERAKKLPPDPKTEFAVIEPTVYGTGDAFVSQINAELAKLKPEDRSILLFVHGFNNTISDSILRLGQFVEDTEFEGVPVLFSWASAAKASHYVYDLNSVLIARPKLLTASDWLRKTNARSFDIFAHSMGTLLTVEAIVQADLGGRYNKYGRVHNVMLAAPDIDIDLFRAQLRGLGDKDKNFFVFVSQDDRALGFSKRISGGIVKAGAANSAELQGLGVTVIDLSEVGDSSSGTHSKFAGSPEVVQLIGKSLQSDHFDQDPDQPSLVEILGGVPVVINLDVD